ncbi:MAG: hypothetical protein LBU23_07565, partial [Planctomycetota bacterium]|nr:hypothetical protein [Planctomycetota bacterium]
MIGSVGFPTDPLPASAVARGYNRKLIGSVGFPTDPLPASAVARGYKRLQTIVDDCLELKSVSIDGTDLKLILANNGKWPRLGYNTAWIMAGQLRIRYFDKNGKFLGTFRTKERFVADWAYEGFSREQSSMIKSLKIRDSGSTFLSLEEDGSQLIYTINARDADYVEHVEVSFADIDANSAPPYAGMTITKAAYSAMMSGA